MSRKSHHLFLSFFVFFALFPAIASSQQFEAVSKPSADIVLSFVKPGRISAVPCKEGDTVRIGKLLAKQEDKADQVRVKMLAIQAADETKIEMTDAELLQKQKDLGKLEEALQKGAATDWETDHARLDAETTRIALEKARLDHEQDIRRHEEATIEFEQLHLLSPIDGYVEEVEIEVGESVQAFDPVIRVVQTDPLLIDVPVPVSLANQLLKGQTAIVNFPLANGQSGDQIVEGKIENIATVAEAASNTLRVRIKVPNTEKRPAGERVMITFPQDKLSQ
jgi:RND family efflux transporter MFP subunit